MLICMDIHLSKPQGSWLSAEPMSFAIFPTGWRAHARPLLDQRAYEKRMLSDRKQSLGAGARVSSFPAAAASSPRCRDSGRSGYGRWHRLWHDRTRAGAFASCRRGTRSPATAARPIQGADDEHLYLESADFFKLYGHQPIPKGRKARIASVISHRRNHGQNLKSITELAEKAKDGGAEVVVFRRLR